MIGKLGNAVKEAFTTSGDKLSRTFSPKCEASLPGDAIFDLHGVNGKASGAQVVPGAGVASVVK